MKIKAWGQIVRFEACSRRPFASSGASADTDFVTKSFNLIDTLSVGVDRIQRNFEPMRCQVESWRETQITDEQAKLIFCSAFV